MDTFTHTNPENWPRALCYCDECDNTFSDDDRPIMPTTEQQKMFCDVICAQHYGYDNPTIIEAGMRQPKTSLSSQEQPIMKVKVATPEQQSDELTVTFGLEMKKDGTVELNAEVKNQKDGYNGKWVLASISRSELGKFYMHTHGSLPEALFALHNTIDANQARPSRSILVV